MAELFRIVHLSDLHFSHGALRSDSHSHSIDHLLGIQSVLEKENYDLVVVTGDLSNRGDPESLNQAKQWLLHQFTTDEDRLAGLRCPVDKLIVVPGNHDAYNCCESGGKIVLARQKSLRNFNQIFPHHVYLPDEDCRYHWWSKNGESLFIVAVDSSYLGDPDIEHLPEIERQAVSTFSEVARGKVSRRQSEQILRWFDKGMKGELVTSPDGDAFIDRRAFARAFKVLVMHHYIFEPPGHRLSFSLRLTNRKTVLRNLAMADFDMVLCGHKHVPAFHEEAYSAFFPDRRTKARYLMNLFRRLIRIDTLPDQFVDKEGKHIRKKLSAVLAYLLARNPPRPGENDEAYFERLLSALRNVLKNPKDWRQALRDFVVEPSQPDEAGLSIVEAQEIAAQVLSALSKGERIQLSREAEKIAPVLKGLSKRPLVQGMCGSSAKSCSIEQKDRAFSIYEIKIEDGQSHVLQREYIWPAGDNAFNGPFERQHNFSGARRLPF